MNKKQIKFSPEVKERAVRLVREQRSEHPSMCDLAPISRTAGNLVIFCLYGGSNGREISTETAIHGRVQD
ncbi:hypothetical protein RY831_31350 [Noviherbaspirillum sp. CPCC 100848]|uniref:Transposase n=1 Tax=Noviherbaspirillum album TaxID=3080276 RepID=A0ABU6JK70_9BURK|nr:hypothetical protein [Noviherbaspirillum sp. CPCC 100848]